MSHHHHHHKQSDEEDDDTIIELLQIVLIRHGKSQAQSAHPSARKRDSSYLDAPLSTEGIRQASTLTSIVARNIDLIDLVITSPLSRALQTTNIAFESLSSKEKKNKIIVNDLFRELNSHEPIPENKGRPLRSLQLEFSEFDFSNVAINWPDWRPSVDGLSVNEALEWLAIKAQEQKLKRVVVVAHSNWISCALSSDHKARHLHVENAEPIFTVLCNRVAAGGSSSERDSSSRRSLRHSTIHLKLFHKEGFEWFS